MKQRYAGAMQGHGAIFKTLSRLWSSKFTGIKAIVLVPDDNTKLTLSVSWNANSQRHEIKLASRNWQTQSDFILFEGSIDQGEINRKTRGLKE